MAYDVPPPEQCPEPGYYYHYKHDPNGPLNNYAYLMGLGITLKMTAVLKMRSCRCTGLYMRPPMPTGTAGCSTCDRSTCSTNRDRERPRGAADHRSS